MEDELAKYLDDSAKVYYSTSNTEIRKLAFEYTMKN